MLGRLNPLRTSCGCRSGLLAQHSIWGQGFQLRPLTQTAENNYSQENPSFSRWLTKTKLVVMTANKVRELQLNAEKLAIETKNKAEKIWQGKHDSQRAELTLSNNDFAAK